MAKIINISEETSEAYLLTCECGCTLIKLWIYDGPKRAVVECSECGATWCEQEIE